VAARGAGRGPVEFGLIPEFVGRLPVIATLTELGEDALVDILTEPKNALVKQYQKLFEFEDVRLRFSDGALRAVARQALGRKAGARGLRSILENVMLDLMYDITAAQPDVKHVRVKELDGKFKPPKAETKSGPGGGPSQARMNGFMPLREDAEKKGKLIKAAGERHAPPDEACKLIKGYGAAEAKMIKYVETNSSKCGIPAQVADQLKAGHKNTEALEQRVCNAAQQMQSRGPAGPTLSDVLGSASSAPEATASRKGGSTFDTLNGNVLAR